MSAREFGERESACASRLIELALAEDLDAAGDVTTAALVPPSAIGRGLMVARGDGVVCGMPIVEQIAKRFSVTHDHGINRHDGEFARAGDVVAELRGSYGSLLSLERTALNFVQRLSGIATLASRFVAAVAGTKAVILDTRKTTPGWRALEKYAVRCGGATNHRRGLFDAVLIKDNHLALLKNVADPIGVAVERARTSAPRGTAVEIEVDSLAQLERALEVRPDIILLDNMSAAELARAVELRDRLAPGTPLEASGGIRLETVRAVANSGVDRISVGAMTHSAPALDIALEIELVGG